MMWSGFMFLQPPAEHGGSDNFLMLTWLLPLVTAGVLILWMILDRVFFRPLGRVLQERHRLTYGRLEEAQELLKQVQQEQERYEQLIAQVRREAAQWAADRREQAEQVRLQMLEEARKETRMMMEQAQEEIEAAAERVQRELTEDLDRLTLEALEKILRRPLRKVTTDIVAAERKRLSEETPS